MYEAIPERRRRAEPQPPPPPPPPAAGEDVPDGPEGAPEPAATPGQRGWRRGRICRGLGMVRRDVVGGEEEVQMDTWKSIVTGC